MDDTCYAKGVSAAFVGYMDGHLIMAGGSNFPATPAAEGGIKRYYNTIYALPESYDGSTFRPSAWQRIGVLPDKMAYGVAVSDSLGMVFVGGCNEKGGLSNAFRIRPNGRVMQCDMLPALPFTMDNMGGALLNGRVYVVGGLVDGVPSNGLYTLDMQSREWFECAPMPGAPRIQPVCVAQGGRLFVWGGYSQPVDSLGRVMAEGCLVHTDGWCYNPADDSWSVIASPLNAAGLPLTLTGSTAIAWGNDEILAVGGVNRNVFLGGIQGIFPMPDYMLHEPEWYRFNPEVLIYSVSANTWRVAAESELTARAGAVLIALPHTAADEAPAALLFGGEKKPGVRTNEVTLIRP